MRDPRRLPALAVVTLLAVVACAPSGASPTAPAATTPATVTEQPTEEPTDAEPTETTSTETGSLPTDGATDAPATPAAPVTGSVAIHGSSTVAPISLAVAEDFQLANPDWAYSVGEEGTGAGFDDFFCAGDGDIADASRPIDEEEAAACAENGVEYVELQVAIDGLAVITSAQNTAVECLTFADLYALLGPESDAVGNWNDAEALAQELGSTTDLPDAPLSITAPGDESGTYDSFIEIALGDIVAAREEAQGLEEGEYERLRTPGDVYVASPSDNVIIDGVAGFPSSLGFVGFAYAEQNLDRVRVIPIDAGDGTCVEPTAETVSDGSYPIARPLYIYPSLTRMAENPAITAYVDYYLSDEGLANATEVGYVAMPAEQLEATRAAWAEAKGGA